MTDAPCNEQPYPVNDLETQPLSWAEQRGFCIGRDGWCRCPECNAYRDHGQGRAWQPLTRDEHTLAYDRHDSNPGVSEMREHAKAVATAKRDLRALAPELAEVVLNADQWLRDNAWAIHADDPADIVVLAKLGTMAETLRSIGREA